MIKREGWGAKKPRWITRHKKPVSEVYIHHGGTTLTDHTLEGEAAALRAYQRYHLNKGWADIAYSFAVAVNSGRTYELRGWDARPGATKGHNKNSYAIVIIGNTSEQKIWKRSVTSIRKIIESGIKNDAISLDVKVMGHRDVKATNCPGDSAYAKIGEMKPSLVDMPSHFPPTPPYTGVIRLRRKPRMSGDYVKWVQKVVGATPDGIYGQHSRARVRTWQRSHGLVADGIVGPMTDKAFRSN